MDLAYTFPILVFFCDPRGNELEVFPKLDGNYDGRLFHNVLLTRHAPFNTLFFRSFKYLCSIQRTKGKQDKLVF